MTDQQATPATMVIEALCRAHLDRRVTDGEMKHWLNILDTRGLAVLVEEIVSSPEARLNREVAQARQKAETLYPLRKIASLRTSDHHTGMMLSEIADEPVALGLQPPIDIPPHLAERIQSFSGLQVIVDGEPDIRVAAYHSLSAAAAPCKTPLFMLVILDDAQSYLDALGTVRFRTDEASLLRAKARRARELLEDTDLQYSELVYLGADSGEARFYPACIFEQKRCVEAEDLPALARYCAAALVFFHLICNDSSRAAEALDRWDAVWGTDLSYRYSAISNAALA